MSSLFFCFGLFSQAPSVRLTFSLSQASFSDFDSLFYIQTKIPLFYKPEWFQQIRIDKNFKNTPVDSVLTTILKGTGYSHYRWHQYYVILPKASYPMNLPDFRTEEEVIPASLNGRDLQIDSMTLYMAGRTEQETEHILIGKKNIGNFSTKARIHLRLKDNQTGTPLPGATVFIEETGQGAVSDLNGVISQVLASGIYHVRFDCLGQKSKKMIIEINADGSAEVLLDKAVIPIDELIVTGGKKKSIIAQEPGLERITLKTVKEIPALMGERDLLKISEMLPGIVSVGEGSAGLNVRGGNSDQNMFYINKVPVYNTSHLFGFFPAFNADLINDFSIYKGFVPTKYGGRLSSVFNMTTRQGNRKKASFHGGINPVTSTLTLEGPLVKDKSSALISARSSYSDWILRRMEDPTIHSSAASFYDLTALINSDLTSSDQLGIFGYGSHDQFYLYEKNRYSYNNMGGSVNWRHQFSSSLKSDVSIIVSEYTFQTDEFVNPATAYQHSYQIGHYEARSDFSWLIGNNHSMEAGFGGIFYRLNRGEVSRYGNESQRIPIDLGREQAIESFFHLSDAWNINSKLNFTAGFRWSAFANLGPADILTYIEGNPKDLRYINDTLHIGKGKALRKTSAPEFRGVLTYRTDPNGSVKISMNQMHQYLFMLSNTIAIAPNTQWKLADYHIKPSSGIQYSAGIYRELKKRSIEISLEGFYKTTKYFTEFKDGADFIQNPFVEVSLLQGDQYAFGVEFMFRKNSGKLDGWFAYTWSRSLVRIHGKNSWDDINHGKIYPANFDIPHAINIIANYHFNRRLILSSSMNYQSGRPATYPKSIYYLGEIPFIEYSSRNSNRIPDYFRTDLSLTIEGNLKKKKPIHSSWMASVYNVTGRKNAYSVFFTTEKNQIKGFKYSVIGVPIFTVTWLFKLGNYSDE